MNKMQWTIGLLTQNFWWKLLALAIAFTIWVLVANEPELSTFTTVRVAYRNIPDDLEISSAPRSRRSRANAAMPVLSVTLIRTRSILAINGKVTRLPCPTAWRWRLALKVLPLWGKSRDLAQD